MRGYVEALERLEYQLDREPTPEEVETAIHDDLAEKIDRVKDAAKERMTPLCCAGRRLTMSNKNEKIVSSLRELADFIEQRPDIGEIFNPTICLTSFVDTKAQLVDLIRNSGGKWDKHGTDYHFGIRRQIGCTALYVYVNRDLVCTARKVVKTIPAREQIVIPAREQIVIPATPEQTVEVTEYDCPDSILRPDAALVAAAQPEALPSYACDIDGPTHLREEDGKLVLVDGPATQPESGVRA